MKNENLPNQSQEPSRYHRHVILPEIGGKDGQEKISKGKVLIIGMGGLGSPVALYLAAAGVGHITIADADAVSLSNLQRQVIHNTDDIGKNKAVSAAEKMKKINPLVKVSVVQEFLTSKNIEEHICNQDFVIDATDNFKAKFLINDACVKHNVPFSHAGVMRFSGQTMTVFPRQSACYRCLFHRPPDKEQEAVGILSALPGIIGSIQASETLKFLTNSGELLLNKILTLDVGSMNFREVQIKRSQNCPVCSKAKEEIILHDISI